MAKDFDPYYKWLGIPPKHQPPNHYRLLAIEKYESDVDVIEAAANRQMYYVQSLATGGEHAEHTQRLLNEIASARLCLASEEKKRAYDEALRATDADQGKSDIEPSREPPPVAEQPRTRPRPAIKPAAPAALTPAPRVSSDSPKGTLATPSVKSRPKTPSAPQRPATAISIQSDGSAHGRGRTKRSNSKTPLIICGTIAGLVLLGFILFLLSSHDRPIDVASATNSSPAARASDREHVSRRVNVVKKRESSVPRRLPRLQTEKRTEAETERTDVFPDAAVASAEAQPPAAPIAETTSDVAETAQPEAKPATPQKNAHRDSPDAAELPDDGGASREVVLDQDDPELKPIELKNSGFEEGGPIGWLNVAVVAHARYPLPNETGQEIGNHFGVTFSDKQGAVYLCKQAYEPSTFYHFQCALGRPDTSGKITFEIGYLEQAKDPRSFVALASRTYPLDRKNNKWKMSSGVIHQTGTGGPEVARKMRIALRIGCHFEKVGAFWFDNVQLGTRTATVETDTAVDSAPVVHELTAAIITDSEGDGLDGKANTVDDTWQFCFEEVVHRKFLRLNSFYKHAKYHGWSHNHDMDTEYEGVWGNAKTGEMFIHPYAEKTDHRAMVVVYTVRTTGRYKITGGLTDVDVAPGPKQHRGILWRLDRQTRGKSRTLRKGGPIGDRAGPDSDTFVVPNVYLLKGDRLCLVIDPNGWWGSDMTRVDSFRIEQVTPETARSPATTANEKAGKTAKPKTDLTGGLVAHWPLNEKRGNTIKDASGKLQGEIAP